MILRSHTQNYLHKYSILPQDPTTTAESEDRINVQIEEIVSDTGLLADARTRADDALQVLRQLPAPMFALDVLYAILSAMSRSLVLADPKENTELLEMVITWICYWVTFYSNIVIKVMVN